MSKSARVDEDEIEVGLEVSRGGKRVKVVIDAGEEIDDATLILTLEAYITELIRAKQQRKSPGTEEH